MIYLDAQIESPAGRLARWSGSAGVIAALHVTAAVLAILAWPKEPPQENERPGAIMIELPSLAAESPSDQQDIAEQPLFEKSAPPPSPAEQVQETPPEVSQAEELEPVPEKTVEDVKEAEPVTEPEELPTVEEAPLAPKPEVTLPKETPKEEAKKPVPRKEAREKAPNPKPAQKSESRQQKKSAASAAGRFDPNPTYRAKPAYPAGARASKIEGYVVVSYSVAPSGAVTGVRVVSASPPGVFNGATVAAVRQWRFKPSATGGSRTTTVRFKLK